MRYLSERVIISFNDVHYKRNIFISNCSNAMKIKLTLWLLMARRVSTRASVDTMLSMCFQLFMELIHWGRGMHICISKLSYNGLSPGQCQAIIWTNAGILLIGSIGTNFSEILIEIQTFPFKKIHMKMSSAKCPFCLSLNVLTCISHCH